jgi:hypothetical protein
MTNPRSHMSPAHGHLNPLKHVCTNVTDVVPTHLHPLKHVCIYVTDVVPTHLHPTTHMRDDVVSGTKNLWSVKRCTTRKGCARHTSRQCPCTQRTCAHACAQQRCTQHSTAAHFAWIGRILMGFAQNTVVIVGLRSAVHHLHVHNSSSGASAIRCAPRPHTHDTPFFQFSHA